MSVLLIGRSISPDMCGRAHKLQMLIELVSPSQKFSLLPDYCDQIACLDRKVYILLIYSVL